MRVMLDLSDEVVRRYEEHIAAEMSGATLEEAFQVQLARFRAYSPVARVVVLGLSDLKFLEERLGQGNLRNADDVCDRVGKLARLQIGHIDIEWTPGQLEELRIRSDKNGRTPAEEAKRVVRDISSIFFDRV